MDRNNKYILYIDLGSPAYIKDIDKKKWTFDICLDPDEAEVVSEYVARKVDHSTHHNIHQVLYTTGIFEKIEPKKYLHCHEGYAAEPVRYPAICGKYVHRDYIAQDVFKVDCPNCLNKLKIEESMSYTMVGHLVEIGETEYKPNNLQLRNFVIEVLQPNYAVKYEFQLVNDRCDLIDQFKINDPIKVSFNIRSNFYEGRYYNSLRAWKVESARQ